jgi:hypothetical protein
MKPFVLTDDHNIIMSAQLSLFCGSVRINEWFCIIASFSRVSSTELRFLTAVNADDCR